MEEQFWFFQDRSAISKGKKVTQKNGKETPERESQRTGNTRLQVTNHRS
ncbi:hypothetical protein A2U01_0084654, partial [Trifolium medium]|nr:hypothetical protein [Trifolium medium]